MSQNSADKLIEIKAEFKQLMVTGKIDDAIRYGLKILNAESEINHELILYSGRYQLLEKRRAQNLIDIRDYDVSHARIMNGLLESINKMKLTDINNLGFSFSEISSLEKALFIVKDINKIREEESKSFNLEKGSLKAQILETNAKNHKLNDEINRLTNDVKYYYQSINNLNLALFEIKSIVSNSENTTRELFNNENLIARMKNFVSDLKNSVEELNLKYIGSKNECSYFKTKIKEMEVEKQDVEKKLKRHFEDHEAYEKTQSIIMSELSQEKIMLESNLVEKFNEISEIEIKQKALEEAYEKINQEHEYFKLTSKNEKEKHKQEIAGLIKRLAPLEENERKLKKYVILDEYNQLFELCTELKEENDKIKNTSQIVKENEELKIKNKVNEGKLEKNDKKIKKLEGNIFKLKAILNQAKDIWLKEREKELKESISREVMKLDPDGYGARTQPGRCNSCWGKANFVDEIANIFIWLANLINSKHKKKYKLHKITACKVCKGEGLVF